MTQWVHLKYVKARFLYILAQCRDAIYRVSTNMRCTLTQWSQLPKPLYRNFNFPDLYVPQNPETGLGAIFGQWPGTETDEEIEAYLEELS